jgi:hypothetical protein
LPFTAVVSVRGGFEGEFVVQAMLEQASDDRNTVGLHPNRPRQGQRLPAIRAAQVLERGLRVDNLARNFSTTSANVRAVSIVSGVIAWCPSCCQRLKNA